MPGTIEVIEVGSTDDPRLSDFHNLKGRPTARAGDGPSFVVEGPLLTARLIASDYKIRAVVVQLGRDLHAIADLPPEIPVYGLTLDQLEELTGFHFHRGFLASAWRRPLESIDQYRREPVSLGLVQTTDQENFGNMVRTAAAFGIRQVFVDAGSVDPYSRRVMRVSMGSALAMRFLALDRPAENLRWLHAQGVTSLAATLAEDSISIDDFSCGDRQVLLVMGNEGQGLPPAVQLAASARVTIPMNAAIKATQLVDSLNVSVAAAILIHELTRGRR